MILNKIRHFWRTLMAEYRLYQVIVDTDVPVLVRIDRLTDIISMNAQYHKEAQQYRTVVLDVHCASLASLEELIVKLRATYEKTATLRYKSADVYRKPIRMDAYEWAWHPVKQEGKSISATITSIVVNSRELIDQLTDIPYTRRKLTPLLDCYIDVIRFQMAMWDA